MEIIGYIAAVFIGISLGLIGGGGSILTVPVLVYLFGIDAVLATSYSLFIVGTTSLIGAIRLHRNRQVRIRTALIFGVTSVLTVFLTRRFLIPAIPEVLFSLDGYRVTKSMATLVVFAILMLLAAVSMIRRKELKNSLIKEDTASDGLSLTLILYGLGIGLVTGLLGAGGGFLLIPALVLLLGLPMKEAVGTSLLIIAMNSLIGFTGDLGQFDIDWILLFSIIAISVVGLLIGTWLGKRISGGKLRKGFGWFVLIMGAYILLKELFF